MAEFEYTEIGNECCANCSKHFKIIKQDYSNIHDNGVVETELEGYCCMAYQKEGVAVWTVGLDEDEGMCEAWKAIEVQNQNDCYRNGDA